MAVGGITWKLIRNHSNRPKLGKYIFLSFLVFQVLAIVGYILLQQKVPAPVFYQVWPAWMRQVVFWLVNASMTLPFGEYVPQLDGVYWSVITEVLFYLLYPVLFLPFVQLVKTRKSPLVTTLLYLAAFPFFYGLTVVFRNVLGLHILEIYLTMYFLTGILLSHLRHHSALVAVREKIASSLSGALIPLCLFLLMGLPIFIPFLDLGNAGNALYWVLPVAVVFFFALSPNTAWSKFLSHRALLQLGTWSYSLYLTHTLAIELFANWSPPTSLLNTVNSAAGAIVLMFLFSACLHNWLEKPYFVDKVPALKKKKNKPSRVGETYSLSGPRALLPILGVLAITLFFVWFGYRVPAPLTAQVISHTNSSLPTLSVVTREPLSIPFTGSQNNLGMILLHLKPLSDKEVATLGFERGPDDMTSLQVQVVDNSGKQLGSNDYPLFQIFESRFHPIGIPIDQQSAGKNFSLILNASHDRPDRFLAVVNQGIALRTVYFPNKSELLKNPPQLASFLISKITQPFQEREAQLAIMLCLPFLILLGIATQKKSLR